MDKIEDFANSSLWMNQIPIKLHLDWQNFGRLSLWFRKYFTLMHFGLYLPLPLALMLSLSCFSVASLATSISALHLKLIKGAPLANWEIGFSAIFNRCGTSSSGNWFQKSNAVKSNHRANRSNRLPSASNMLPADSFIKALRCFGVSATWRSDPRWSDLQLVGVPVKAMLCRHNSYAMWARVAQWELGRTRKGLINIGITYIQYY